MRATERAAQGRRAASACNRNHPGLRQGQAQTDPFSIKPMPVRPQMREDRAQSRGRCGGGWQARAFAFLTVRMCHGASTVPGDRGRLFSMQEWQGRAFPASVQMCQGAAGWAQSRGRCGGGSQARAFALLMVRIWYGLSPVAEQMWQYT
jgi:hypothetical protein